MSKRKRESIHSSSPSSSSSSSSSSSKNIFDETIQKIGQTPANMERTPYRIWYKRLKSEKPQPSVPDTSLMGNPKPKRYINKNKSSLDLRSLEAKKFTRRPESAKTGGKRRATRRRRRSRKSRKKRAQKIRH